MGMLRLIRDLINFIYVFAIVNDNFIVNIFGETSLKALFAVFFVANIATMSRFNLKLRSSRSFLALIIILFLSYLLNFGNYANLQQPLFSILSVLAIFLTASLNVHPQRLMKFFLISVVFSCMLCITTDATISEYTFRKTGGTGDPNEFSLMALAAIGYLAANFRVKASLLTRSVKGIALIICLVAMFMAGSKSAMLTMVIVFMAYYLLLVRKRSMARKVKNTIAFLVLFTLLCVVLWRYYNEIILNVLARFEDNSSAGERLLSWKAGLELWMTDPFLGVGPQNYVHMIAERFPYIAESSRAAHNMYIQSFVEIGLVGFIAFASFLYSPIRNSFRMRLPMEYVLGIVSILVMGMTLSTFFEKYVWLYFGLMCNPYLMYSDYRKR